MLNARPKRASIFTTLLPADLRLSTNGVEQARWHSMEANYIQQEIPSLSPSRESTSQEHTGPRAVSHHKAARQCTGTERQNEKFKD
jgi:hypothetical protein